MKKKIRTRDLVGDLDKRSDENLKKILIFIGQDILHDYSEVDRDIREELESRGQR